jgi:CarD family transcriptional regulator
MRYSVGDKVVHPGYGPGIITSIERREVFGEAKRYYVIDMLTEGGTLMTPVKRADEVGLRPAIDDKAVKRLLKLLTKAPGTLSGDFRERQTEVEERLKDGDIYVIAEVVRDLTWRGRLSGLTKRDTQLMQRAEQLLAGELALVREIAVKEALEQIQAVLAEAMCDPLVN